MNCCDRKKIWLILAGIYFVLCMFTPATVKATTSGTSPAKTDITKDIEYDEIQKVIDQVLTTNDKINFEDYVTDILTGNRKSSLEQILKDLKDALVKEVKSNISTFTGLISIAVIAAVFTNFSYAFQNTQVAETGFYVAYLLLFSILTASFISAATLAANTISAILDFMKALVPAYFISVAFCSSAATSMVYYQVSLFLITFVDMLLVHILIPMINIYLVISMANNLSKEDLLSKLADLISEVIRWSLKTLIGLVVGFNAIQGLILPVADSIKKSTLLKLAGAIPGIGNALGGVTESVIGAGILLKNAIGVAGVIVIITVCAVPIIKLAVTTLIYRVSSAAVQPISDKRMLKCVTASADACVLLLQTVIVGAILFLLTITIIAATTN
ncbi:stage III sporulation protein AE [Anaerocolumna cellulosilytica]|uniref:Stage III sporulation protein AE n=1 Tax=Anaerocolumna cellulosilytica TaxID=433286 RepID=A0A6S6R9U8_9FIRM|nr:stage III sporulation protein AE [Anaerocolumna cellulosilytica]MBB5196618.1 stage III sporulation protein AE [Anaerocolumna cellulosilytica]BCJ95718.1 stage III sporulation protein AE [Anaerocolumna cellulosilytica]